MYEQLKSGEVTGILVQLSVLIFVLLEFFLIQTFKSRYFQESSKNSAWSLSFYILLSLILWDVFKVKEMFKGLVCCILFLMRGGNSVFGEAEQHCNWINLLIFVYAYTLAKIRYVKKYEFHFSGRVEPFVGHLVDFQFFPVSGYKSYVSPHLFISYNCHLINS